MSTQLPAPAATSCTAISSATARSAKEWICETKLARPTDQLPSRCECSITACSPATPSPSSSEFITTLLATEASLRMKLRASDSSRLRLHVRTQRQAPRPLALPRQELDVLELRVIPSARSHRRPHVHEVALRGNAHAERDLPQMLPEDRARVLHRLQSTWQSPPVPTVSQRWAAPCTPPP